MMFEGEDSSVMMTEEDETQHKGSEETEKPNKSSHGNEVKYFMQYNAAISIFSSFKTLRNMAYNRLKWARSWSIPHKRNSCHKAKNKTRKSSFFEIETTWTQRLFEYSTLKHMKRGAETFNKKKDSRIIILIIICNNWFVCEEWDDFLLRFKKSWKPAIFFSFSYVVLFLLVCSENSPWLVSNLWIYFIT